MTDIHVEAQVPPDAVKLASAQEPKMLLSHVYQEPVKMDDSLIKAREAQQARIAQLEQARVAEKFQEENPMMYPLPERCREAEVTLLDGRIVLMRAPGGASEILAERILSNRVFADEKLMSLAILHVKAALCVKAIDGANITQPCNAAEYQEFCNKLGNDGIESIFEAYLECFPPVQKHELKIVKKF